MPSLEISNYCVYMIILLHAVLTISKQGPVNKKLISVCVGVKFQEIVATLETTFTLELVIHATSDKLGSCCPLADVV